MIKKRRPLCEEVSRTTLGILVLSLFVPWIYAGYTFLRIVAWITLSTIPTSELLCYPAFRKT